MTQFETMVKKQEEIESLKRNKKELIQKLKSLQDAFENIGDICDETEFTTDDQLDAIRLRANGELAELEQMIIKLETNV